MEAYLRAQISRKNACEMVNTFFSFDFNMLYRHGFCFLLKCMKDETAISGLDNLNNNVLKDLMFALSRKSL